MVEAGISKFKSPHTLLPARPWTRLFACALLSVPLSVLAQDEIAPFKVKDVSGDFIVGYSLDDRTVGENFTESNLWREELFFRTQSYVYHPAMLDMQIDGGLSHFTDAYKTNEGSNRESELLFDYDALFNFLARKTYPFSIYARRTHPEMVTNLLGRYLARSDEYGARGRVLPQGGRLSLRWDLGHLNTKGSGFGSTVDEEVDRAEVTTMFNYLGGQNLGFDVRWYERLSRSGSAGLPIQESLTESVSGGVTAENRFGTQKPLNLRQSVLLLRQTTTTDIVTDIDRLRYNGNLRWRGLERHSPYLRYNFQDEERTSSWTRFQDAELGTIFRASDRLEVSGRADFYGNETPELSRDRSGISANAGYSIPLAFGTLRLTGSLGVNRTNQESDSDTAQVFDERHVLTGTVPVPLNNSFVVEETVIVTNVAQTQTFVVDLDYRLVTVGSTTTIERIISGNIFDGQEVLVNYEFQTGGTAEYRDTRQGIGLSLGLIKYLNVYANWSNVDNSVKSGNPTVPLNDVSNLQAGIYVDVPFSTTWSVGGQVRYTNRDETISPAVGMFYDAYLSTQGYRGVTARLGITKQIVDNEFSTEDVDLLRYFVTLSTRLPGAALLSYTYSNAKNTGGSLTNRDEQQRLQIDWRYRLVVFTLRAYLIDSEQGTSGRTSTRVVAEIRRAF